MASPSTFEGVWGVLPEKVDLEKPEGSELSLWYWPVCLSFYPSQLKQLCSGPIETRAELSLSLSPLFLVSPT